MNRVREFFASHDSLSLKNERYENVKNAPSNIIFFFFMLRNRDIKENVAWIKIHLCFKCQKFQFKFFHHLKRIFWSDVFSSHLIYRLRNFSNLALLLFIEHFSKFFDDKRAAQFFFRNQIHGQNQITHISFIWRSLKKLLKRGRNAIFNVLIKWATTTATKKLWIFFM